MMMWWMAPIDSINQSKPLATHGICPHIPHQAPKKGPTWTMPICVIPKYACPFTISIIPPGFAIGLTAPGKFYEYFGVGGGG